MSDTDVRLPRVTIQFCTQCKWNLRAAYYAQELLQTFSTSIGEVVLQPSTGGIFKIDIYHAALPTTSPQRHPLWDRATDGGFPEPKELKRRVRDVIEPGRNLGHVDRDYAPRQQQQQQEQSGKEDTAGAGVTADKTQAQPTAAEQQLSSDEAQMQRRMQIQGEIAAASQVPPRPRDIAANASTLTHPSAGDAAQQPRQREWGAEPADRTVPGGSGVGGTKPAPPPQVSKKDDRAGKDERVAGRCEDCE